MVKVPETSNFLFSHLILYFTQWSSATKFFDLDKTRFFYEFLKKRKILLRLTRAADQKTDMLRVVT